MSIGPPAIKYIIEAKIEVDGVVDRIFMLGISMVGRVLS